MTDTTNPNTTPPLVYCAGRFSAPTREGVEENIKRAVGTALDAAAAGAFPCCPHSNTAHPKFEELQPYPFWIAGTLELLRRCDAILMVPGWEGSSGARGELAEAIELCMPVFYDIDELQRWLRNWQPNQSPGPLIHLHRRLGPNAQRILLRVAQRLAAGTEYGDFTQGKDWDREAQEEAIDMAVYLAAKLEVSRA